MALSGGFYGYGFAENSNYPQTNSNGQPVSWIVDGYSTSTNQAFIQAYVVCSS